MDVCKGILCKTVAIIIFVMRLYYRDYKMNEKLKLLMLQRCQERLAMNRQSFVEKFRQNSQTFNDEEARLAIHNLVLNEWPAFQKDNHQPSDLVGTCLTFPVRVRVS